MPTKDNGEWTGFTRIDPEYMELLNKQEQERDEFMKKRGESAEVEEYEDNARKIYGVYKSFIKAGFDEAQAWKILMAMISKNN